MAMRSRQSVPTIRVDLPDGSSSSLSSSSTLNIRDILIHVKPWPNLLAEDFVFDDVDDALFMEDGGLQDVPSFPMGHRPPFFILQAHRSRLPFPIRQEAFELGDICLDEDYACPLLTAPTVPRMKMMIKEQLFVQKWANTLTPDNPPKHIPWSCEKPTIERKWIAEGSIFPADMVKVSPEHCVANQQPPAIICTNKCPGLAARPSYSSKFCAPEVSAPVHVSTKLDASRPAASVKSRSVDPHSFRGESEISRNSQSIVKTSQLPPLPTLLPSGPPTATTATIPNVPLAARRGKPLGALTLQGSVIEQLEYPDTPTAFRGSSSVWSPQFDAFPVSSFTDHQSMLLDLRLKGAALRSGISTYNPEKSPSYPETTETSFTVDELICARGLAASGNLSGSVDNGVPVEIIADTSLLPDDSSTPAKSLGSTASPGCVSRPHSTLALRLSTKRSSDPPGAPLPPRPALISPSTPPHVRGILKKVKSVRFEDTSTNDSQTSPVKSPPQAPPDSPSSHHLVVFTGRPCTPVPNTTKGPTKEIPSFTMNTEEKKPAPRSRLPPKRTKTMRRPESLHPVGTGLLEVCQSATATTPIERPCRIAHVKRNTNQGAVFQQARQKSLSVSETDVRRGIEGNAKSRLSVPLRNIFRFK